MKDRWAVAGLHALAWVALAAGLGTAIVLWVTAPETVTTAERISGHGTITFEGVKTTVSAFQVWMGVVSLGAGAFVCLLSLALAWIAERVDNGLGAHLGNARQRWEEESGYLGPALFDHRDVSGGEGI